MNDCSRPLARRKLVLAAAAVCALATPWAMAQDKWPARPIKIIVPFPPGGSTDAIGRLLATELGKDLGQPVIVDNKGGANGNIGADNVAKSPADGYTLLLSGIGSNAINYAMYPSIAYSDAAFSHVALLATGPGILVVNQNFPAKSLQDLIRLSKENPGKYANASAGNGSSGHLAMELLKQSQGLTITHVPYKGNGPAITDVIGGQVPMMVLNNDVALPQVQGGKFRALAVTSKQRNPAYPGVPTVAESGVADFDVVSWFGLSAPAGTPPAIVARLAAASHKAMNAPKVRQYLEASGFVVGSGSSADFSRFVGAEVTRWKAVVQSSGASVD